MIGVCWKVLILVLFLVLLVPTFNAFTIGPGSCDPGDSPVAGGHLDQPPGLSGSLFDGSYEVEIAETVLNQDIGFTAPTGVDHTVILRATESASFRGFLLRLSSSDGEDDSTLLSSVGNNVQVLPLCTAIDVGSLAHTDAGEKMTIQGTLNIPTERSGSKFALEVTVVRSNNDDDGSVWYHTNFALDAGDPPAPSSEPSFSQVPTEGPDDTTEPSLSMTPSEWPSLSPSLSSEPSLSQLPTEGPDDVDSTEPSLSMAPSELPSLSSAPSFSQVPTEGPDDVESTQPSLSILPSKSPSLSSAPSLSDMPSELPSLSSAPSLSNEPTAEDTAPPPQPTPSPNNEPITPIPFVLPVTGCSSTNKCERCEGHCDSDDECEGDLVCWKKGYIASKIPFCLGTDWSLTDWCVIEPSDTDPIPYVLPVRDCSTSDTCERCEGHCQNDDECEGDLICTQKDGRGANIPNCLGPLGDDESLTEWCVNPEDIGPTPAPVARPPTNGFVLPVRNCEPGDKCARCEGHCSNDDECEDGLICHDKGYKGSPIPGCEGTDWSWTEWCIEPPGPDDDIPFVLPVRQCTTQDKCPRCAGHCENDDECEGDLVCTSKSGPGVSIPGCSGPQDDSRTEWCVNPPDRNIFDVNRS